jgi:hypothetical protein
LGTHHHPSRLIASPNRFSIDAVVVVAVVVVGVGVGVVEAAVVRLGVVGEGAVEYGIGHSPSSQQSHHVPNPLLHRRCRRRRRRR